MHIWATPTLNYTPTVTIPAVSSDNFYIDWEGDSTVPAPTFTPYIPYTEPVTTYSWTYPSKAILTIDEANVLRKAAKKDKNLAAVLRKLIPYIEVSMDLLDDED